MSATPEQIAAELEDLMEVMQEGQPSQLWQDDLRAAAALIRAQAERVRMLESALRPFAYAADGVEPSDYDALIVAWIGNAEPNNGGAYGLHASDFRRARAALRGEA